MGEWQGSENNRYELSETDRAKGGQAITERKRKANALNALKTGKYAKSDLLPNEFLDCNRCEHRRACPFYRKDSSCKVQGAEPLRALTKLYGSSAIELLQEINKELIAYGLRAKHSDRLSDQHAWVRLLIEFYRLRFGSKEMVLQVSRNLNDEEFESLLEAYRKRKDDDD